MPDSQNGGNNPAPKKDLSMETRLLLAFLLMGAVMFVTPYLFKQPPAANKAAPKSAAPIEQTAATTPPPAAPSPAVDAASREAAPAAPLPGATKAQVEPNITIDTNLFRVMVGNQGANVRSWILKKYHGNDGK